MNFVNRLRRPLFEVLFIGIVLVCHLSAYVQLGHLEFPFHSYYLWSTQYRLLIFLSCLISLPTPWITNGVMFLITLLARVGVLLLLGLPLGRDLSVEQVLLVPILYSAGLCLRSPSNLCVSGLILVGMILSQVSISVMGKTVPVPPISVQVGFGITSGFTALIICVLRCIHDYCVQQDQSLNRIQSAVSKLTRTNLGYQDFAVALEAKSHLAERQRISREIHDVVGYTLTNVLMLVKTGRLLVGKDPGRTRKLLKQAINLIQDSMREIRMTLYALQARDIEQKMGIHSIRTLVQNFEENTGVKVEIRYGNVPDSLGSQLDLFVYRMIQEGITNAFKHSRASVIRIGFWQSEEETTISIYNNDNPSPGAIRKGIGLSGMEERLKSLGGCLHILSRKDGFEIQAFIPRRDSRHGYGQNENPAG